MINNDLYRSRIESAANVSAKSMSNISKERLGKLQFPLPSIELQNQFADFVRIVDKSKVEAQKRVDLYEELLNKKMSEYFMD